MCICVYIMCVCSVCDFLPLPHPCTPNKFCLSTLILSLIDIPFSQGNSVFFILVPEFKLFRIRTEKADIYLH